MGFDPITAALDIGGKLIDKIWPDKAAQESERAKAQVALLQLAQAGDLAQMEVNKVEASSSSVFVAGWRPFVGWVCGMALAFQFVVCPIGLWTASLFGYAIAKPPVLDGTMWELVFGMLGLGGLRTFEKTKGVAR